jgi:hypothetical protein
MVADVLFVIQVTAQNLHLAFLRFSQRFEKEGKRRQNEDLNETCDVCSANFCGSWLWGQSLGDDRHDDRRRDN